MYDNLVSPRQFQVYLTISSIQQQSNYLRKYQSFKNQQNLFIFINGKQINLINPKNSSFQIWRSINSYTPQSYLYDHGYNCRQFSYSKIMELKLLKIDQQKGTRIRVKTQKIYCIKNSMWIINESQSNNSNKQLQFEYFICDLKTEVMNRIKSKTFFEQSQLFYLLFLLLEISSQYETNNQKSGNIKPQNILINNSGEINLITKNSYPTNISNYTTSLRNQQITYLSPQEMCYLKQTIQNPSYNKSKAQAFSIGMTLLHLCVLENLDIIYDIKKKQIKSDKLEQYINLFKQDHKYSPFFKNIILILLNFDQMQRFSPTEIFVYLSPYQYEIKNLQFFQPDLALCETALNNYQHNNQLIKIISNPKTQTVHRLGSSILKSKISSKIQKSIEITFNHPLSSGISAKKRFNKSRQILRNDQIFCRNNINEQQQGLKGLETKKQKMNQNSVRKNQKTVQKSEELYQQNKKW